MNDKFKGVSDEALSQSYATKKDTYKALVAKGQEMSDDDITTATALSEEIDEIAAEQTARTEAAAERAAQIEALSNKEFATAEAEDADGTAKAETEGESEGDAEEEDAEEEDAEEGDSAEGESTEQAAGKGKQEFARKPLADTAKKAKRPARPAEDQEPRGPQIVAAANVDGFNSGAVLPDIDTLTAAVVSKMKGFAPPSGDGTSENLQKFAVASIQHKFSTDLVVDRGTDDYEVVQRAGDESRLESTQGRGSLTAAGGWCAPSETLYDLMADETTEGILSLPEMQVRRGGVRFTEGPQFADFYANAGFIQTEAQAIAGTTKPCYEVDCPDFTEVRLDAVGLCIKVPILTNAAWPELTRRFTSGSLIAHQHMVNADVIGRMVALSGAVRTFGGLGSTASDTLEALELVADQRRQSQRLALNKSMEVVVPFWVKGAVRNDLSRRTGQQTPVTDQQITAHFAARNLAVSFVYDWQPLPVVDDAGTVGVNEQNTYPATFRALVYPAGTFIKGTSGVINLSAVYDAASLAVNTYTGLFMEEGLLVLKRQYGSDYVEVPVCNAGRTGAADLVCA